MKTTKLGTQIKNLADQFERESWLSPKEVEKLQFEKLERLAGYCEKQSPLFAKRLRESKLTPATLATPEGLKRFPLLTRRDLQSSLAQLRCKNPPQGHMPEGEAKSSGSTGEPVVLYRTAANQVYLMALVVLEHFWHQRDPMGRLCVVRATIEKIEKQDQWAVPIAHVVETGPSLGLPISTDIPILTDEIIKFGTNHLWIYPSTLQALTEHCKEKRLAIPPLQHIRSMCGNLTDSVRQEAEQYFDCKVADTYSSGELGPMAFECPVSGLLHVAAPSVMIEVLNEAGEDCQPGEIGRIVVTDLMNFATPMIRYDIADYAEVGPPCPCGRGWPTLKKIMGRERNLIRMPNGERHWPSFVKVQLRDAAPVKQFQFIQHSLTQAQVRLVVERPLSENEESDLRTAIHTNLGAPFEIEFAYFEDKIPVGASGKFEEFMCAIA
jgi:phenylacetate-CoA ligase